MNPHTDARRQQRFVRIMGGLVLTAVATGVISYALKGHHHPQGVLAHSHPVRDQGARLPSRLQSQRSPGPATPRAAARLAASFQQATHQPVPSDLETVTVPWASHQIWVIDPIGITSTNNPNPTLWFGEKIGTDPWQWIPSTLPGALNPALPKPVLQALQWAWDLNQGQAGPPLDGTIQWSALTGHVGMPAGWTMHALPAADSPLGQPTITLTVWMRSYTGSFTGYYGVATAWDARHAATGNHGLMGLQAAPGPLSTLVQNP